MLATEENVPGISLAGRKLESRKIFILSEGYYAEPLTHCLNEVIATDTSAGVDWEGFFLPM